MKSSKLLALLTALALTLGVFTVSAFAEDAPDPAAEPMLIAAAPEAAPTAEEAPAAVAAAALAAAFTDAASIKNAEAVAALVSLEIINGIEQPDGTFVYGPDQNITREQMAKMVALGYSMYTGKYINTNAKTAFTDVTGRWSQSYVAFCANNGIINGRSEDTFDYAGSVTVTETAKLILAAAGVEGLVGDSWKALTLAAANTMGLLEGVESGVDDPITRDEAALVLSKAVEYLAANYEAAVTVTEAGEVVSNVMVSNLPYMTSYTRRDDSGSIYLGYYVKDGAIDKLSNLSGTDAASIAFDVAAQGPGFTALYATGEKSVVTATGTLKLTDDGDGTYASDFSGAGTAIIAAKDAKVTVDGMNIETDGFVRDAFIVDSGADLLVKASTVVTKGANPLTEAYGAYVNSANQSMMLSPPWVLGIQGGVRSANVLGDYASLTVVDSTVTAGSWAVLSTDACTEPVLNILDTTLAILPESEGGMDSGDFEYSSKYGSGYGTYSIGFATENFYGSTVTGATYGTILRSGYINYLSSKGKMEMKNVDGEVVYSGEGKGNPTTLNTVFGVMTHSGEAAVMNASEGTVFNTEEAAILYKDSQTATFSMDNCVVNSGSGIILQMIDDDDSIVGMGDMSSMGFNTKFAEAEGWPSENGSVSGTAGGAKVYLNLTNGNYTGDALNGTGYYKQGGDNMYVTIGEGATLTGAVSLTETQHKVKNFTINEYYYLGHVENRNYWNGVSTAEVTVKAGSTWTASESLITKLVVEEGATVYGVLTVNADGTLTIAPSATETIAAGSYGTIEAQAAAARSGGPGGR